MSDEPSPPSNQRSGEVRRTALKSARIIAPDGTRTECLLRNISDGGARLELPGPQLLPHTFVLDVTDMPPRLCNLRWAKGNLVGVMFLPDQE